MSKRASRPPRTASRSLRRRTAHRWVGLILLGGLGVAIGASCAAGGSKLGDGTQTGGVGGQLGLDGGQGGGLLDPDSACAVATDEANMVPVNMYIMFDKSGSMVGARWMQTTAALQAFFGDPESAGLRVALRFFPDTGCDGNSCDAQACAQPKVPLGELTNLSAPTDAQEQALINSFVDVVPSGGTPLSAALQGATQWATSHLAGHPTEKAVVVLVTDGEPTDCDGDHGHIVALAQSAYDHAGVLTFAIGLEGSSESLINQIAQAGHTDAGIFIGSVNAQEELLAALTDIRESTVACEFIMPDEVGGQQVDPDLVNIFYSAGGTGEPFLIGQVGSAAECTMQQGGWYYDNPADPQHILFCPSTCTSVRADPNAKIDILYGCSTVPA